ncbi:hypothetical protein Tco_1307585, partial [Tanacetum coccineum]
VLVVPADPIVASEEGTVSVVSPVGVLDSVDYLSSSDSDLSEDSLPPAQICHWFHPFFSPSPVVALPGIRRRPAILVRPGEAIPFGRLYCTHLNRPSKLLTERKRFRPILARRLAWIRVSHHSSDRHSSLDLSSSSSPSDHSLSGHTPPMLIHLHHIDLFIDHLLGLHGVVRLLDVRAPTPANLLPPRKRFRDSYSPEDSRKEHMEVDTANAEAIVDVGISEGVAAYTEDSIDMRVEIAASDVWEDDEEFEAEASTTDTREIDVDPLTIGDSSESFRGGIPDLEDTIYDIVHYMSEVRIDRITEIETTQRQLETSQLVASGERASLVERIGSLRLEYLKVRAMLSIERDRIGSIRWYIALLQEEFHQVRRDRDDTRRRLRRLESTMTITRSGMTPEVIEELVNRRVEEALADHEATRAANALEDEN